MLTDSATGAKLAIDQKWHFYYMVYTKNFINICQRDICVNELAIFIFRAIFAGVFAIVITRMFRPFEGPVYVVGLGLVLVGLAYGLEYYRKRRATPKGP